VKQRRRVWIAVSERGATRSKTQLGSAPWERGRPRPHLLNFTPLFALRAHADGTSALPGGDPRRRSSSSIHAFVRAPRACGRDVRDPRRRSQAAIPGGDPRPQFHSFVRAPRSMRTRRPRSQAALPRRRSQAALLNCQSIALLHKPALTGLFSI
jgi:hypothetical protein